MNIHAIYGKSMEIYGNRYGQLMVCMEDDVYIYRYVVLLVFILFVFVLYLFQLAGR